jgi:hypothetical protein
MNNPNYITNQGNFYGDQPPAKVKQMAPAPQPINPRMLAAAMQQMQAMNQPPMSGQDGVSITISVEPTQVEGTNYVDAYQQQGQEFSQSDLGQRLATPFEDTYSEEHQPIRKRSAEILSDHLGFRPQDQVGDRGFYDPGSRRMYRR